MQFFPGTGILRSTQMIVLHEGQGSETLKEEGIQGAMEPGTKGVCVVNNSQERDRRRSLNHSFMP